MRELAIRIGVTTGFISLIENGKASPSLATLKKIADTLNTTLSSLVAEDGEQEDSPIVKRADRRVIDDKTNHLSMQMLTRPKRWKTMEPIILRYMKKLDPNDIRYRHAGEEFAFVIKGRLIVILDGKEYILRVGDSIYFNSGIPHVFMSGGKGETEVLSVNTPPNF